VADRASLSGLLLPTDPADAAEAVRAGYLLDLATGRILPARLPLVGSGIRTGSVAASLVSDASAAGGNFINLTCTGNPTFGLSNPTDHQVIAVHFLASGANRTVTLDPASIVPAGGRAMSYVVPQNEVLIAEFRYIGTRGTARWALTRAEVTSAASSVPVQNEAATATSTSASYAAPTTGAAPSAVFVAPPSGIVRLDYSGALVHGTAGQTAAMTPEIRLGNVVGSGTVFWAATDSYRLSVKGTNDIEAGRSSLISSLVPGTTYNARMLLMATAATAYFARMRLAVSPA